MKRLNKSHFVSWVWLVFVALYSLMAYWNYKLGNQFNFGFNVGFAIMACLQVLSNESYLRVSNLLDDVMDHWHDSIEDRWKEMKANHKIIEDLEKDKAALEAEILEIRRQEQATKSASSVHPYPTKQAFAEDLRK